MSLVNEGLVESDNTTVVSHLAILEAQEWLLKLDRVTVKQRCVCSYDPYDNVGRWKLFSLVVAASWRVAIQISANVCEATSRWHLYWSILESTSSNKERGAVVVVRVDGGGWGQMGFALTNRLIQSSGKII
jgi:hypothetical protein